MSKFESLEANKTHDFELFDSFRAKIKGVEENSTREIADIRSSLNEMAMKIEKSVKSLDKTFSFQETGVTRRDFEDFERKITEKIEENLAKNTAV